MTIGTLNNSSESRLKRSTTNQETINILACDQLIRVLIIDRSTIDDSDSTTDILINLFSDVVSDDKVSFLGDFRGGSLASSDGPDGFVSNNDLVPLVLRNSTDQSIELGLQDICGLVGFSLLEGFTNAVDNGETLLNGILGLGGNDSVGLAIEGSSFGMAQDSPLKAEVDEVLGADFTSEGTESLFGAVLGTDLDIGVGEDGLDGRDLDENGGDDNIALVIGEFELVDDGLNEFLGLGNGVVALPVATNESSSLSSLHLGWV